MKLLEPIELKGVTYRNRIAMAPLTRSRASEGGVPSSLAPEYYAQRASAVLIISEATCISMIGRGYPRVPGIWSKEQVEAWKPVTQAVHAKGGSIILQLWHTGRHGLASLMPNGPVSASDVRLDRMITGYDMERHPADTPRPLSLDEIASTIEDYAIGTKNALEAGFDGVQIHGANGYLIDQFLRDDTNLRTDQYGGSALNRVRFLIEVTDAVVAV
ncbi:MAG: alkene reductase, partial [Armatimonadota bacterium]